MTMLFYTFFIFSLDMSTCQNIRNAVLYCVYCLKRLRDIILRKPSIKVLTRVAPFPIPTSEEEEESDLEVQREPILVELPSDVRQKIYSMMDYNSLLSCALTSRKIYDLISEEHGFRVQLTGNENHPVIRTGIELLVLNNFVSTCPRLSNPDLLKEVTISGQTRSTVINQLLNASSIRILKLKHPDPQNDNVDLLQDVNCSQLTKLEALITKELPHFFQFLLAHGKSLNSVRITTTTINAIPVIRYKQIDFPVLRKLHLEIDRISDEWIPFLTSVKVLEELSLNIRNGVRWGKNLRRIISSCSLSIQTLVVVNIFHMGKSTNCSQADLSLLCHCTALRNLTLSHKHFIDEEEVKAVPRIINASLLPPRIQSLTLSYFVLRTEDELTFLLHYPELRKLTLRYWIPREGALSSFLGLVDFVLQANLTSLEEVGVEELLPCDQYERDQLERRIRCLEYGHNVIEDRTNYGEISISVMRRTT